VEVLPGKTWSLRRKLSKISGKFGVFINLKAFFFFPHISNSLRVCITHPHRYNTVDKELTQRVHGKLGAVTAEKLRVQLIIVRRGDTDKAAVAVEGTPADLTLPPLDPTSSNVWVTAASSAAKECRARASRILAGASRRAIVRAGGFKRIQFVNSMQREPANCGHQDRHLG